MLPVLIAAACLSIVVSFCCSLLEAVLYAVPYAHVRHLSESGSKAGEILVRFKRNIGKPIAAVLILNTISNTAGAAVAGAQADKLWGKSGLLAFSVFFTLAILFVSEISPKVLGVTYSKRLSVIVARPLDILITVFGPVILLTQFISRLLGSDGKGPRVSEEEVVAIARLGTEQGTLDRFEGSVISNVIGLDDILVRDVLTPRVSVLKLSELTRISDIAGELQKLRFTRIPLFKPGEQDNLTSYVIQRDIYRELLNGRGNRILKDISRKLHVVPELMNVDMLLKVMFERGEHIVSVVDEHGALAGVITLEDVLEEIVGREIEDEYD